jgi:hypothetical protein
MEFAIIGILVASAVAGVAMIISAVILRNRVPPGEPRSDVASGRFATGIVLIALPFGLVLLGLLFQFTIGRLGTA